MAQQILLRRDTAANWTSANPVLGNCEIGVESNTGKTKIGDGSSAWASLGYSSMVMASTTVPTARLGTGTASSTTVLAGDSTWQAGLVTLDGGTPTSTFAPVLVGVSYVSTAQIAADAALTSVYAQRANNLSDVASVPAARTNLGVDAAVTSGYLYLSTAYR